MRAPSVAADDRYYLVVPRNGVFEGSCGTDSLGRERPASAGACLPQRTRVKALVNLVPAIC